MKAAGENDFTTHQLRDSESTPTGMLGSLWYAKTRPLIVSIEYYLTFTLHRNRIPALNIGRRSIVHFRFEHSLSTLLFQMRLVHL